MTPAAATVGDAMLRAPRTHPADLTVAGAWDAFGSSTKTHMILLVADGVLLATLTRDDLASPVSLESPVSPEAPALPLGSLAGRTVRPDAPLAPTYEAMRDGGVRRLAVVDESGRLLGLLCLKRSFRGFCTDEGVAAMRLARAATDNG